NRIKGKLIEIEEKFSTVCCIVLVGEKYLRVKLPKEIFVNMNLNINDEVWLILNLRKLKTVEASK
ncbi:MAG: hypothetical protein MUP69_03995, partial [Candidatus Atribacteria bacterium]|nr:hypothetical protein [Candidatus Atribacteria bacterium]